MENSKSRFQKYDGSGLPPTSHKMIEPKRKGSMVEEPPEQPGLLTPLIGFLMRKGLGFLAKPIIAPVAIFMFLFTIYFFYTQSSEAMLYASGKSPIGGSEGFFDFLWNVGSMVIAGFLIWKFLIKKFLLRK